MKAIINFFKWLWNNKDRKTQAKFDRISNNPNFKELTEEEMKTIRSGPVNSSQ